jgi:AraC-like DNA-binding protein/mannose-6-phosphate isomerase-like protein (cupin superfamily)
MDMRNFIFNEKPLWKTDMVEKLNRFPIAMSQQGEWMSGTDFHYHPGVEIHIMHDGEGVMVIGRQVLLQFPRSVLVFRGMVPHQMLSKSSYKREVITIHFDDDSTALLPSLHRLVDFSWIPQHSCLNVSLNPKQFQHLEEMCKALRHELRTGEVGWERMALGNMLLITAFLQRSLDEPKEQALSAPSSGKKSDLVQQCSNYVCRNLGEDLTLKTVSKRFAVSGEYLTRSFTREMGISFYQYVLLQRVAEGKRLLREASDVSIEGIAYMIGFPSPSHFNRHFKKWTEETPSSYRQKVHGT